MRREAGLVAFRVIRLTQARKDTHWSKALPRLLRAPHPWQLPDMPDITADHAQCVGEFLHRASVDLPAISLPNLTFTVGQEGAQGMWGESVSMLQAEGVQNPSNAQIEAMDKQLLSASPGVTTLQIGQQLNFPNGSTTAQGNQAYDAVNTPYQIGLSARDEEVLAQEMAQSYPSAVPASVQEQQAGLAAFNDQVDNTLNSIWSAPISEPTVATGSGAQQSPDMVMQSIGYMTWAPMTPAQANGVARADEALLPAAAAAAIPGLGEIVPAAELTSCTGVAIMGGKTAVGFGLGYFGAKATGTVSTTGDVAAGLTGAIALNFGGPVAKILNQTLLPSLGTYGNTVLVSGIAGSATEFASQAGDNYAVNRPLDIAKVGYMGLTTAFASATMGEGVLAAGADSAELGPVGHAVTDTGGATTTGLGSFFASKIWEGNTGEPTPAFEAPVNSTGDLPTGGNLISPIGPNDNQLLNVYPE